MAQSRQGTITRHFIALTVDATPDYASGDVLDDDQEITLATRFGTPSGKIVSAMMHCDEAGEAGNVDLVFFGSEPATAFTDNGQFTPSNADLELIVAVMSLNTQYSWAASGMSVPAVNQVPIPFELLPDSNGKFSQSLWVVAVTRAANNFAAATDVTLSIYIEKD